MNIPFLNQKKWPRNAKPTGESRYGFSEDDDVVEHALDELMAAYEAKDSKGFMSSFQALIELIKNKENTHADP